MPMNDPRRTLAGAIRAGALLAALLECGAFGSAVAAAVTPSGAAPPLERLTGTVAAVDFRAGHVDLLTGVGHALRVRRVLLPAGLKVRVGAAESAPAVLAPGCVVRMECGHTRAGTVASKVTLLRTPGQREKP